jgi:hypothetical protein
MAKGPTGVGPYTALRIQILLQKDAKYSKTSAFLLFFINWHDLRSFVAIAPSTALLFTNSSKHEQSRVYRAVVKERRAVSSLPANQATGATWDSAVAYNDSRNGNRGMPIGSGFTMAYVKSKSTSLADESCQPVVILDPIQNGDHGVAQNQSSSFLGYFTDRIRSVRED